MGAFCSPDFAPWTPCWLVQVGNCRSASVGNHLSRLLRCRGSSDESKRGNFCDSIYTPKSWRLWQLFIPCHLLLVLTTSWLSLKHQRIGLQQRSKLGTGRIGGMNSTWCFLELTHCCQCKKRKYPAVYHGLYWLQYEYSTWFYMILPCASMFESAFHEELSTFTCIAEVFESFSLAQ